jgi:hypothetical protein
VSTNKDSAILDVGARAQCTYGKTLLGLSYHLERDRDLNKTIDQDVGIDLAQSVGKFLFCRGDMTFNTTRSSFDNYEVLLQAKPIDKLSLTASFYGNNIKPDTMDIFATKIFKDYQQVSATAAYALNAKMQISAGYLERTLSGNNVNHEIKCRFEGPCAFAEFLQDFGYGGYNTQGNLAVHFWKTTYTEVEAGGTFMRYGLSDTASEALYAWVGRLALDLKPAFSWFNSRLELQYLKNRFYQYDTRLLFITHINFSKFTTK